MADEVVETIERTVTHDGYSGSGGGATEWESVRSEVREMCNLMRETLTEVRAANQASSTLVPSLLETNSRLTDQLSRMPAEILAVVSPLLTPPPSAVVVETPPSDTPLPEGEENAPSVVVAVEQVPEPEPAKMRPKFRFL